MKLTAFFIATAVTVLALGSGVLGLPKDYTSPASVNGRAPNKNPTDICPCECNASNIYSYCCQNCHPGRKF
ncbi:unnamed protein product [Jaminaea pallidilutea]